MFGISSAEFALILIISVFVVGPKQMPDVLRMLGRSYRKLNRFVKKYTQVIDDIMYDADRIADKAEKTLTADKHFSEDEKTDDR